MVRRSYMHCTCRWNGSQHAMKPNIGSGLRFSAYPTCTSTPPLGGYCQNICHAVWYGKSRMVWLPDGENILKIRLFVLTEFTNVMDRQTDGHTDTAWRLRPRLHSIARQKRYRKPGCIAWSRVQSAASCDSADLQLSCILNCSRSSECISSITLWCTMSDCTRMQQS